MLLKNIIIPTALIGSSHAAPLKRQETTWTIQAFTRSCDDAAHVCSYSFHINENSGSVPEVCIYQVVGTPGSSAEKQSYNSVLCDGYMVGSTWSGQFGPGQGFQTLSIFRAGYVCYAHKCRDVSDEVQLHRQIIYPAYADSELVNGIAVSPDKAYIAAPLLVSRFGAPSVIPS